MKHGLHRPDRCCWLCHIVALAEVDFMKCPGDRTIPHSKRGNREYLALKYATLERGIINLKAPKPFPLDAPPEKWHG